MATNARMRAKKVTTEQKELLVLCLETQPQLMRSSCSPSFTSQDSLRVWQRLADKLATVGDPKSIDGWKQTWKDMKRLAKEKKTNLNRGFSKPGVNNAPALTELEERICALIGKIRNSGDNNVEELGFDASEMVSCVMTNGSLPEDASSTTTTECSRVVETPPPPPPSHIFHHTSFIPHSNMKRAAAETNEVVPPKKTKKTKKEHACPKLLAVQKEANTLTLRHIEALEEQSRALHLLAAQKTETNRIKREGLVLKQEQNKMLRQFLEQFTAKDEKMSST